MNKISNEAPNIEGLKDINVKESKSPLIRGFIVTKIIKPVTDLCEIIINIFNKSILLFINNNHSLSSKQQKKEVKQIDKNKVQDYVLEVQLKGNQSECELIKHKIDLLQLKIIETKHQYEVAENALNHIRREKAKCTADIIKEKVERFELMMKIPQVKANLSDEEIKSFLVETQKIHEYLVSLSRTFVQSSIDENIFLSSNEIGTLISEMFGNIKAFYAHVKSLSTKLEEKSPHRKLFIKLSKVFVRIYSEHMTYFQKKSKNPAINQRQYNKDLIGQQLIELEKELNKLNNELAELEKVKSKPIFDIR